ncbi:thiopurine S-methyltransferase [Pleionea sediminis]|uniref:thiopurine S-methyltransferase n=1 Tax=Pleionea sediminis TaxID=2569479 RepID=UPI0011858050|nr:thiopurine S-methyltransferase [Pleionea sediminis]
MNIEFWKERWESDQIGFHLERTHPQLIKYFDRCFTRSPIFIPLCGKSLDILFFLEQGCSVIGCELSEKALEQFEHENNIPLERSESHALTCYQAIQLKLYCCDFFALSRTALPYVNQVYDRAALIALPKEMRSAYVKHLLNIIPRPLTIMLVTLEYEQADMAGPPFSVDYQEVCDLYTSASNIERIHYNSIIDKEPHFKALGLNDLFESVYKIIVEN